MERVYLFYYRQDTLNVRDMGKGVAPLLAQLKQPRTSARPICGPDGMMHLRAFGCWNQSPLPRRLAPKCICRRDHSLSLLHAGLSLWQEWWLVLAP